MGPIPDLELDYLPRLPRSLTRLSFRLTVRGQLLRVEVSSSNATYSLLAGDALELVHHGERANVEAGSALTLMSFKTRELHWTDSGVGKEGIKLVQHPQGSEYANYAARCAVLALLNILNDGTARAGLLCQFCLCNVLVEAVLTDARFSGVSMMVGSTQFTLMLWLRSSAAIVSVNRITALLEAM